MVIEKKNTAELLPAEYNPRKALKPGDSEYEKLKRSIEQFGYVEPVIWNKTTGHVVGGHQRLKVLQNMGITEVDCVVVELSEEKEKALNIALNKISGEWDKEKLALLITDLQGADFDVSLTGFEPAELDDLFKDSMEDVGDNLKSFGAGVMGNAPHIVIFLVINGLIALIVVLIVRGAIKSAAKRRAKKQQN